MALRVGSHVGMAFLWDHPRRTRRRWAAAGVAAVVADTAYSRWMASDDRPHAVGRAAYESVEAAVWALAGRPDPITSRLPQIASVVPAAIEWGLRTGSGDRTVPPLEPARPFPPEPGDRLATVVRAVLPTAAPHVAMRLARRSRGWPWHRFEYVWPAMGLAMGTMLGTYRQQLHREARSEWLRRAQRQIAMEESAARAQAAVRESEGHHFKKNLVALGAFGSEAAAIEGRAQMAHPQAVVEATAGASLFTAALGIPVEPPELRDLWLSEDQRVRLEAFVDEVDDALDVIDPQGALHPPVLHVLARSGTGISLRYRGEVIELRNPPPPLRGGLDPIPATLAVSGVWKLLAALAPGASAPPVPSIGFATLDWVAAIHQHRNRHRPQLRPDTWVLAASIVSAAAFNLMLFADPPPTTNANGEQVFYGTSPSAGLLVVVATYWDQLGAAVWPIVGATVGMWLLGAVGSSPRPAKAVLLESITLWQALLAGKGLATSLDAESQALEEDLQVEFQERVRDARLAAVRGELARFRLQLETAERELARLGDAVPADIAARITDDCATMRTWLEDPWTEHRLAH